VSKTPSQHSAKNPPLKVLLATPTFPPFKDGVAQAAIMQARALAAEGFEVIVATEPHPDRALLTEEPKIKVREFAIHGSLHFRNPYCGDTDAYIVYLRSTPCDVIVFHSYSWPLYLAAPILQQLRARKVLTSHGYGGLVWTPVRTLPFGLGSLLWSFFKSMQMLKWYKCLDRVVFLSTKIDRGAFYDHFLARFLRHTGIRFIPNGVEVPDISVAQPAQTFLNAHGIPHAAHLFLCVANYSWRKDQGFAVRAFREAAIPDSILIFIGSEFNECSTAFQKADAKAHTCSRGERVVWLEKIDRENTLGAIQACDTFVLSANHEAQPIALLEAMSYGKPWIARAAGCIDRMEGGLCVKSVRSMAKAMRALASGSELRSRLGATGRLAVQNNYNHTRYGHSYSSLLRELSTLGTVK
jgi:glycosyltransferase involved in cell wall biosynthesis